MMTHVVSMVVDGVSHFVKTIWGLQERRWSYTFDAVTSAAVSVTVHLQCFSHHVIVHDDLHSSTARTWISG
ncbi:hypothetical protein TSUD_183020 [Trifolium subterraneum]|uniref:Uncharacterized protein n=1 Tax=Trifolium subterraneum TaxID=3900 RepID=A0A2Z6PKR5_TRISU|nr:hypothetical protein TSUD_183020 [Trifolium subterraneum]